MSASPTQNKLAGLLRLARGFSAQTKDPLEETTPIDLAPQGSSRSTVVTVVVCAMAVAIVAWASLFTVEQIVVAKGFVRPIGEVKTINHPVGGRVVDVLVAEGDRVVEGQVLAILDSAVIEEEIARLTNEWLALVAEVARLNAEAQGLAQIEFPAELLAQRPELAHAQTALFAARRDNLRQRRLLADQLISQRQSEVNSTSSRIEINERGLAVLREQAAATKDLVDIGHFPRLRYLSLIREVYDRERELVDAKAASQAARSALAEARERRIAIDTELRSELADNLANKPILRDRALSQLVQRREEHGRTVLRSPVDGTVQNLQITGPGQSIRPGDALVVIVPTGVELILDANLSNEDIGYVFLGQSARVKVTAYDSSRYGTLPAEVAWISADLRRPTAAQASLQSAGGASSAEGWYSVFLKALPQSNPGKVDESHLRAGMSVEVNLLADKRSIMSYLTGRLNAAAMRAFTERG